MNEFHILNGDALAEQTKHFLDKTHVSVAREVLMDGPVNSIDPTDFWTNRAAFIHEVFGEDASQYMKKVVPEFEKIKSLTTPHKIYLWFEYDLFCQVNFWFCLDFIKRHNVEHELYWVRPNSKDWKGFGACTPYQLEDLRQGAYQLSLGEIQSLTNCWKAYQHNDKTRFEDILKTASIELQFLKEVVDAHFSRLPIEGSLTRPEKSLIKISKTIQSKNFKDIFPLFSVKEGIYGYGDLQVEKIWNTILTNHSNLLN